MKPHPTSRVHCACGALAALLLAGGLAVAQAQQTPPAGQPMPPSAPPSAGSVGGIDEDEARAIMAARERCGQEAGAQAQQDCMNRAQQDYYRARSGGAAGGSMPEPGASPPDGSAMPQGRPPASTSGPGTPGSR